jgi:hypothetical protein
MRKLSIPFLVSGAAAIAVTTLFAFTAGATRTPGRIEADEATIVWTGPQGSSHNRAGNAEVSFVIRNVGGQPVQILEIKSGCGCAAPEVTSKKLLAGQRAEVRVSAIPPAIGERAVPITLETDSPVTRTVDLVLKMSATRKPPFLLRLSGVLAYLADDWKKETREFEAITFVTSDTPHIVPVVTCDLPFIKIEPDDVVEEAQRTGEAIQRNHRYRITVTADPGVSHFSGTVKAVDPWDPSHVETLPIHGEIRRPVRWVPSVVRLQIDGSNTVDPVGLVISTLSDCPNLRVVPEPGAPLLVEQDQERRSDLFHRFRVRFDSSHDPSEGEYAHQVISSPGQENADVIPVKVVRRK